MFGLGKKKQYLGPTQDSDRNAPHYSGPPCPAAQCTPSRSHIYTASEVNQIRPVGVPATRSVPVEIPQEQPIPVESVGLYAKLFGGK